MEHAVHGTRQFRAMMQEHLIAIVDDDESVRLAMESLVRSFGYKTCAFKSAKELLDWPMLGQTSCVISDIQMPGMDGEALQHELKARHADLPIILVTAFADERRCKRMMATGATCYLAKPVDDQKLIACLETALGRR